MHAVKQMKLPALDTRPNKHRGKKFVCEHVFPELTSVCPVTRLPDFYTMKLAYEPDAKLVELKSLKLYLIAYRNVEILHEELANQILDDLIRTVNPNWASIQLEVNVRGGIRTSVSRYWSREKGDEIRRGSGQHNEEST
jgi:7-cyano-7-deazaguanine reductase